MTSPSDNWIVYDGDCPFCRNYIRLSKFQEAAGPIRLINARDGGPEVEKVKAAGLDLDQGMVLNYNGRLYHGDECLNMMALLSSRSDLFNKVAALLFRSPAFSRVSYPVLRCGRNMALRLLGKKKISGESF